MEHTLNTLKENPVYTGHADCKADFFKEYSQTEYTLKKLVVAGKVYIPEKELTVHDFDKAIALYKFRKRIVSYLKSKKVYVPHITGLKANEIPVKVVEKGKPSLSEQMQHTSRMSPHAWTKKTAFIKVSGKIYYRAECRKDTAYHYSNCGAPLDKDTCLRRNSIKTIRKVKQVEVLKVKTDAEPDYIRQGKKTYINK